MIRVSDMRFRHAAAGPEVLCGVDFAIAPGEVVAVLGPNGCGKTTLMRCVSGQWRPTAGQVTVAGHVVANQPARRRALMVASVAQDHEMSFDYDVFEVVLMGRTAHVGAFSAPGRRDRQAAEEALAQVGVSALAARRFAELSGGERQMVMVARALAQAAPVLLLDEPTSHLDLRNQLLVLQTVRAIAARQGLTVLMSLHDPNLALAFADRVLMLADGGVHADGPAPQVVTAANLATVFGVEAEVVELAGRHAVVARRAI